MRPDVRFQAKRTVKGVLLGTSVHRLLRTFRRVQATYAVVQATRAGIGDRRHRRLRRQAGAHNRL